MRLIDADALKESIHCSDTDEKKVLSTKQLHEILDKWIDAQPTIEERKTGKWIQDQKSKRYRCDQCLSFALKTDDMQENLSDFCPVCGARMAQEGEQP